MPTIRACTPSPRPGCHSCCLGVTVAAPMLGVVYTAGASWMIAYGIGRGGAWLWLLFPGLCFGLIALGFLGVGGRIVGKRSDGTIPAWAWILYAPFFLMSWSVIALRRAVGRRASPYDEVVPRVFVGRWCLARSLPAVSAVIDLTVELPKIATASATKFLCIPTFDTCAPRLTDIERAIELIEHVHRAQGAVFIHCAAGRGRSATIAAAWLLARTVASGPEQAEEMLRKARPGIRLTGAQRAILHKFAQRFSSNGSATHRTIA